MRFNFHFLPLSVFLPFFLPLSKLLLGLAGAFTWIFPVGHMFFYDYQDTTLTRYFFFPLLFGGLSVHCPRMSSVSPLCSLASSLSSVLYFFPALSLDFPSPAFCCVHFRFWTHLGPHHFVSRHRINIFKKSYFLSGEEWYWSSRPILC